MRIEASDHKTIKIVWKGDRVLTSVAMSNEIISSSSRADSVYKEVSEEKQCLAADPQMAGIFFFSFPFLLMNRLPKSKKSAKVFFRGKKLVRTVGLFLSESAFFRRYCNSIVTYSRVIMLMDKSEGKTKEQMEQFGKIGAGDR